jgi:hypothetical protein
VSGNGVSATFTNAEVLLLSPGSKGAAAFVASSSQDAPDGGMVLVQPPGVQAGFLSVNLQLAQIDAGVFSNPGSNNCGQMTFSLSAPDGGLNGWGAGVDCDGGSPEGTWTLTLTSVGPPVLDGSTGTFFYNVNGTLVGTMPSIFGASPVQLDLSF